MNASSLTRGTFAEETTGRPQSPIIRDVREGAAAAAAECGNDMEGQSPPYTEEEGRPGVGQMGNEEPLTHGEPPDLPSPKTELKGEKQSDKFQLQEDIFALLFVSPVRSQAFLYSVFWFTFQAAVIALIAYDMLKDADGDNFFKAPSAVHPAVSAAQVLALAVAVISQDDVISTLALVSVGYDSDRIPAAATRAKWILSNVCRFLIGLASLFISFLFVVQSEGVLDLFKDFAAMAFVSEIDDAAFALAKRGFLSDTLEEATRGLEGITFEEREDTVGMNFSADRLNKAMPAMPKVPGGYGIPVGSSDLASAISIKKSSILPSKVKSRLRRLLLFLLFGLMVALWGVVYSRQKNGDFYCQTLSVRFGPEHWGALHYSYFSGTYELGMKDNGRKESVEYRPVYYERGPVSERLSGKFFYCLDEMAWVFGIEGIAKSESDEGCMWLLRSPETESFDLADVPISGWSIWTGNVEETDSFRFKCNVCNSEADCNYHGSCDSDGGCICDPGRRGEDCQLEDFCDVVQLYRKDEPLLDFSLLLNNHSEPILVYDRPVYFFRDNVGVNAFIYTGRRWYYIVGWILPDLVAETAAPFFHAYWRELYDEDNLEAYSEPTESSMPTGIGWYVVSTSRAIGDYGPFGFSRKVVDAEVHCKAVDCDIDQVCGKFGECFNQTCVCETESLATGHFCEYGNSTFSDYE